MRTDDNLCTRVVAFVLIVVLVLLAPPLLGKDMSQVVGLVGVYALLALGLNIVVGYAGMLHLGFVFFLAFGAYTAALLTGATLNIFTGSTEPAFAANLNFYVASSARISPGEPLPKRENRIVRLAVPFRLSSPDRALAAAQITSP